MISARKSQNNTTPKRNSVTVTQKTLQQIADFLGCDLIGNKDEIISGVASIETAKGGEITFVSNSKYSRFLETSGASAFIIPKGMEGEAQGKNLIISNNTYFSFAKLITLFHERKRRGSGIDLKAVVGKNSKISESASIYPNVFIDDDVSIGDGTTVYPGCFVGNNVTIGNNCTIYPNVSIMSDSVIGNNVTIHPGSAIGGDGFGYAFHEGIHHKIPQVGRVVIEDNVEIGSCVTIDRAALGETFIGAGTKIDNLVMVAHNVKVGKNSIIVSQAGISGSSELGNYVIIGGKVGVAGHLKIGDNVKVAGFAGVTNNVESGATVGGFPAVEITRWRKAAVLSNNLPDMRKKIIELEKRIKELDKRDA